MKTYDLLNMEMDELICWLQDNSDLLILKNPPVDSINLSVISKGYNFIVNHDNELLALTAGDHHYERTGIKIDLDFQEQALIDKDEAFVKAWQAFNESKEPTAKGQLKDALEAIFND